MPFFLSHGDVRPTIVDPKAEVETEGVGCVPAVEVRAFHCSSLPLVLPLSSRCGPPAASGRPAVVASQEVAPELRDRSSEGHGFAFFIGNGR